MSGTQGSIFYMHAYGRKFPVPLMALEAYAMDSENATTDEELFNVLITTLSKHCGVAQPNDEDIAYFVSRLTKLKEEITENSEEGATYGKTFGSAYMGYISDLPIDGALLKMVHYDIDAAEKLYCDIDRDDAVQLVKDYIKGKAEENLVKMEAAMYGMGGSYEEDKGSKQDNKEKGIDISTEEGAAALRALGF